MGTGDGSLTWLPETMRRHGVTPRGVLHIGAHEGEEVPVYLDAGFSAVVLVEPDLNEALKQALEHPQVRIVSVAVASGPERRAPWQRRANTHQSGLSGADTGDWVRTVPLSTLLTQIPDVNVLVVDTSGTELDVLASGPLERFDMVVVETDGAGLHASPTAAVTTYMFGAGFRPVERWAHGPHSYGDEVFVSA